MDCVRAVADVVLYEGYLLWPYRRSALKNQRRWTIGGVYPRPYAEKAGDHWTVCAEFLMEEPGDSDVEFTLRFLHAVHRQVMDGDTPVDEVRAGDETFTTWQEAREREITSGRVSVARLLRSPVRFPVAVAAGTDEEEIGGGVRFTRLWRRVDGTVEISAVAAGDGLVRLRVEVVNTGPGEDRDGAVHAAMLCAHVVARAGGGGAFVSPSDPPEPMADAAATCVSDGLWPVLAGPPGSHDTVLASPIVLYDWPQVAPESPGDLFDGTEIDRLLILGVLSLGDGERREMAATDPRAAEILERCASLSSGELLALHGTMRDPRRDVW
ncbi:hypothetical protein E1281_05845 [Actinomadura sp. KC345]|uniref:hypothetical protein n=1 Tax=Actinomadura sp. KC345 TaxID=2530371 RepID=UPI0010439958|nr:hypothetical protein [Actinomadura sp. KC345]TDC57160.1 hypothetical protein E1281_05845 [Actinomadura sp. KC345]